MKHLFKPKTLMKQTHKQTANEQNVLFSCLLLSMNIFFCASFSVESIFHRRQDNVKNSTSGHSSVGLTAGMQDIRSASIQTCLSQ